MVPESEFFESHELVDDERVVVEELLAADDGQIGEEVLEGGEAVDAVEEEVAGDLAQVGVRVAREGAPPTGRLFVLFDEDDVDEALDHRAVLQLAQLLRRVADVQARADCK